LTACADRSHWRMASTSTGEVLMRCYVCNHSSRVSIEAEVLDRGRTIRSVAGEFRIHPNLVERHLRGHVPREPAVAGKERKPPRW
jgi:hypothetical protein